MKFLNKFRKKIAFVLIVSTLSLNLTFLAAPKRADAVLSLFPIQIVQAIIAGAGTVWDKMGPIIQKALTALAKIAARKLIEKVTQATVDWINGGMNGKPAYIADLGKFLTGPNGVADQAIGQFFQDSSLGFLCQPFQLQVKLALQLGYGLNLQQRLGCTLSQIKRNINNMPVSINGTLILNNSSINVGAGKVLSQGGWDEWLRVTQQPQNNPVGAYLTAKAEMDAAIVDAQGNKIADLNFGQGALSFKRCVDTYRDRLGNETGKSGEYTEGGTRPVSPSAQYSTGALNQYKQQLTTVQQQMRQLGFGASGSSEYQSLTAQSADLSAKIANEEKLVSESQVLTTQNCAMKTPGSAITGMLLQKSTSDVRQSELTASLANGLDAIFSALANALIAKLMGQLQKGVLDKNVAANDAYNSALDTTWADAMNTYNTDVANLGEEQNNMNNMITSTDWQNYNGNYNFPGITDNSIPPFGYGSSTFDSISPTSTVVITAGVMSALDRARNNSSLLINSLIKSERAYQNNYKIAQNVLIQGKAVFATSSVCNLSYNRNDSVLRSLLIRSNVITNIDGVPNSDRTLASIPWNLKSIDTILGKSNANLIILNKASTDIAGASSIMGITDAMIPVNSTSFNTDPQPRMVGDIKFWLNGVGNMYNAPICPIDLTKVLQINSPVNTTY